LIVDTVIRIGMKYKCTDLVGSPNSTIKLYIILAEKTCLKEATLYA